MRRALKFLIILIVFCVLSIFYTPDFIEDHPTFSPPVVRERTLNNIENETTELTCQYRKLDPWDPSILNFIDEPAKIDCGNGYSKTLVFVDTNGYLRVNSKMVSTISYLSDHSVACSYQYFDASVSDPNFNNYQPWIEFYTLAKKTKETLNRVRLTDGDFIRVACYPGNGKSNIIYRNIYAHGTLKNKRTIGNHSQLFSLLFLILDGVSGSAFRRHMPVTYSYLIGPSMRGKLFNGFTKSSTNSFANIMLMLTGNPSADDGEFEDSSDENNGTNSMDQWRSFIWKEFADHGYFTSLLQDSIFQSGLFNTPFEIRTKPTDFYYRPFYSQLFQLRSNETMCGTDRLLIDRTMDILQRQLVLLNGKPHFSLVYLSEMIRKNVANLELMDGSFVAFLGRMNHVDYWADTVLFMVGSNGPPPSRIRTTLTGMFEERMPLLIVRVPRKMRLQYPRIGWNLRKNTNRLTTHFDVYETLRHILYLDSYTNSTNQSDRPGSSLFTPISNERTCDQAGIPAHSCPCQTVESLDPQSEDVQRAASYLIDHINGILENYGKMESNMQDLESTTSRGEAYLCQKFKLNRVLRSERFRLDGHQSITLKSYAKIRRGSKSSKWKTEYPHQVRMRILIECNPGHVLFEVEVIQTSLHTWTVTSDINRLNPNEHQSRCIQDVKLKPICVCK